MNPLIATEPEQHSSSELPPPLAACGSEIEQLRSVGRMFHARGWSLGTSSNYSIVCARDPLRLIITASGKDKGALQPTDFVLVDRAGNPVKPGQPKASAETLLHCLLAEQENVGAILHTHSVWATLLSDFFAPQQGFIIDDYEMLKGLEGISTHQHPSWVQIFENSQDIRGLADEIRQHWQEHSDEQVHGFLLRQHGLYTWGRDLFAARRHVEIFEFLFECIARKLMLNGCASAATRLS